MAAGGGWLGNRGGAWFSRKIVNSSSGLNSDPDLETIIEYEMGYAADEFGKVLCGPFSGEKSVYRCMQIARHHWSLEQPGMAFELAIKVAEKPPRKLGLFNLPVLEVIFCFTGTETALRDKFFHRFHQYFHKGGG
jgi:hypothetical protein